MTTTPINCSIAATTAVIGDRWTLLILRTIFRGHHRFNDIADDVGIARNLLSDRLNKLVDAGVIERVPYQDRPVRCEYRLTAKGADLSPALIALMRWGDRWYADDQPPVELYHDRCGQRLELSVRCSSCGETVGPTDISSRHPNPEADRADEADHAADREPSTDGSSPSSHRTELL